MGSGGKSTETRNLGWAAIQNPIPITTFHNLCVATSARAMWNVVIGIGFTLVFFKTYIPTYLYVL